MNRITTICSISVLILVGSVSCADQTPSQDDGATIPDDTGPVADAGADTDSDTYIAPWDAGTLADTDSERVRSSDTATESETDIATDMGPDIDVARSALPYDTAPEVDDADYQTLISGANELGLELFKYFAADDTNVVLSPLSTAAALAILYAGARNNTAAEMALVLHSDLDDTTFHAAMNRLLLELGSRNIATHLVDDEVMDSLVEKRVKLSVANGTWGQEGFELLPLFLDTLATHYDSGVNLLDFSGDPGGATQLINEWVSYKTEGLIPKLMDDGAITPSTRLVLTNALHFYGSWHWFFDPVKTEEGPFHTLNGDELLVPMMTTENSYPYPYAVGDGYQLVDIPYDGEMLAMTIVLPDTGRFADIRDRLSSEWMAEARAAVSTEYDVLLTLPLFDFTWGTQSLKAPLMDLGMVDAFGGGADFSGMTQSGGLVVSDVLQQATIDVFELGTQAAAATTWEMDMMPYIVIETPILFTVDRPFFFFIRDVTDTILFTGQVVDPS